MIGSVLMMLMRNVFRACCCLFVVMLMLMLSSAIVIVVMVGLSLLVMSASRFSVDRSASTSTLVFSRRRVRTAFLWLGRCAAR